MKGGLIFGMIKIVFTLMIIMALWYLVFQNLADTAGIFPAWVVGNPISLMLAAVVGFVILLAGVLII